MKSKLKGILSILAMVVLFCAMSLVSFAEPLKGTGADAMPAQNQAYPEGTVEAVIYKGLLNMEEKINLTEFHLDEMEVENIYQQVINDNPELFYVFCFLMEYSCTEEDYEIVAEIYPRYIERAEKIETMKTPLQAAVQKALSGIEDSMTDLEKALYLHDYILTNCDYDWLNYLEGSIPEESFSAYGCLVNGKAVSVGYTLAYAYLLHEVGIETEFISGWNQSWNAVMLDGKYYFVDLIWDDPIRYRDCGSCFDYIGHDYFLLTAAEILDINKDWHMGWTQEIDVSDKTYQNAPFRKVDSPISYYKGEWYYWCNLDNDYKKPAIVKTTDLMTVGTPIHSLSGLKWSVSEEPNKSWKGYYGNVDVSIERGILYYCTNSQIFSMNLEDLTEAPRLLHTIDTTNGYLYGLRVDGDVLSYGISTSPYVEEEWFTYDLNTEVPEFFTGDVNKDGEIDANDALAILKSVGKMENKVYDEWFADCDGNSQINANDALWVLKKAAKLQ